MEPIKDYMFPSLILEKHDLNYGVKDLIVRKQRRLSITGDVIITYKELAAKPLGLHPAKNWRTF